MKTISVYDLIGSASTLEGIVEMIKSKWSWQVVNLEQVSETEWSIASGTLPCPNLRIIKQKNRYRFEIKKNIW